MTLELLLPPLRIIKFPKAWLRPVVLALSVAATVVPASATSLAVRDLVQLTNQASYVVSGECVTVQKGTDQRGLPHTVYVFRVEEYLKGAGHGSFLTIRQVGWPAQPPSAAGRQRILRIPGMPEYTPGRRYLLFLRGASKWGYSSPIGFAQGVFTIRGEGPGMSVVNALDNRNLATERGVSRRAAPLVQGPVSYRKVADIVRETTRGRSLTQREIVLRLRGGAK